MGIQNYGNTCYLGSSIQLIKQIPGMRFANPVFQLIYQTPEKDITEKMIWELVRQCGLVPGVQNDAMEMVMKMLMDVGNKNFEIVWEIQHYIKVEETPLPLYNAGNHKPRSTTRSDRAYQIRLSNLDDRVYRDIQEMLDEIHFSAGGPGDTTILTDFNDPDYSPEDYISHNNARYTLRELMNIVGGTKLPSCKREVYQPDCQYLLVTLDVIDYNLRRKRLNLKIENPVRIIRFESGVSYTPVSMICHMGASISFGHYINYTTCETGWFMHNDERVLGPMNMNKLIGDPYIILYMKC
jgi:hypothetical protein